MRILPLGLRWRWRLSPVAQATSPEPAKVAAAGAVDWAAAERREILLTNFDFTPATIELEAGKPYILHLVNRGTGLAISSMRRPSLPAHVCGSQ